MSTIKMMRGVTVRNVNANDSRHYGQRFVVLRMLHKKGEVLVGDRGLERTFTLEHLAVEANLNGSMLKRLDETAATRQKAIAEEIARREHERLVERLDKIHHEHLNSLAWEQAKTKVEWFVTDDNDRSCHVATVYATAHLWVRNRRHLLGDGEPWVQEQANLRVEVYAERDWALERTPRDVPSFSVSWSALGSSDPGKTLAYGRLLVEAGRIARELSAKAAVVEREAAYASAYESSGQAVTA